MKASYMSSVGTKMTLLKPRMVGTWNIREGSRLGYGKAVEFSTTSTSSLGMLVELLVLLFL